MELLNLMITNINLFTMISNHETWGINTDLFETNIINLSVVIGLLIFYGRITLSDIVNNRKEIILRNLQEAENKAKESEEMLALARSNYERAEITKEKILAQGLKSCNLAKETLYATLETDLARLKEATSFTLKLKEKKYFFDLYDDILDSSFSLATKNFSKVLSNKRFRKKKFLQKTERLYRM